MPARLTALQLARLTRQLADDMARLHFNGYCETAGDWYRVPPFRSPRLHRALLYLRARDLLEQNPLDKTQFRTR